LPEVSRGKGRLVIGTEAPATRNVAELESDIERLASLMNDQVLVQIDPVQPFQQFCETSASGSKGLARKVVHAGSDAARLVLGEGIGGHGDDGRLPFLAACGSRAWSRRDRLCAASACPSESARKASGRQFDGCSPSSAVSTASPISSSSTWASSRLTGSSSTTRMRRPACGAGGSGLDASAAGSLGPDVGAAFQRAVNQKVLPSPGVLLRAGTPPISSARRRVMARPRPVPPNLRVVEASACSKTVNKRCMVARRCRFRYR
jgi:hypothetical protein